MANSTAKEEPFSIIAGTDHELDLLIRYHFFITGQIGQMAIHPLFKQDIKKRAYRQHCCCYSPRWR
jgi:hypothetical protein